MKIRFLRTIIIFMILPSIAVKADVLLSSESACEKFIRTQTLEDCEACAEAITETTIPTYYCDCQLGKRFKYGMDTLISDTTWFQSTVGEIAYTGLTAYWFSSGAASIDIYTSCISQKPMMSLNVGSYRSASYDANNLISKMEQYGFSPSAYSGLPVYIRVAPKGEGRVLGYEYGEGFHSDCEDLFQIYYNMQLYHSNDTDTYQMPANRIVPQFFIRWKQEKEDSVYISLLDKCDSKVALQTAVLTDSVHLFFPDSTILKQYKAEKKPLYFRFVSKSRQGRIEFIRPSQFVSAQESADICFGSYYELNSKKYYESATIVDTTFVVSDTCLITTYDINVSNQQTKKETVQLLQSQLGKYKFHDWYTLSKWGTDQCEEQDSETGCITHYNLKVVQKWNWTTNTITETLCHGKTYQSNNGRVKLTETATVRDTIKSGDNATVTIYKITFTEPESDKDELECEQLPCAYNWKGNVYNISNYGDTTLIYASRNKCDEAITISVKKPVTTAEKEVISCDWKVVPTFAPQGETIQVTAPQSGWLTVMDILGRTVYQDKVEAGEHTLPNLQMGQYLVRLQSENERYNSRIIIR